MQLVSRTNEQKQAGLTTARILLEIGAVNFRPTEPYILTSGWASPVYIDMRRVISYPRARRKITELAGAAITRVGGGLASMPLRDQCSNPKREAERNALCSLPSAL